MRVREALALLIGYLLGSVLPADILARARGVDIRGVGTRNPGTTNALEQLGVGPGLLTAAYDMSVGLVAMSVASRLGVPAGWVYLSGIAAIVGHRYPVFFGFRGGEGMAAATGMLIFEICVAVQRGWLTAHYVAFLAALGATVFVLTRSATVVGVATLPLLLARMLLGRPDWRFAAFVTLLSSFVWVTQTRIARRDGLLHLAEPVQLALARLRSPSRGRPRRR